MKNPHVAVRKVEWSELVSASRARKEESDIRLKENLNILLNIEAEFLPILEVQFGRFVSFQHPDVFKGSLEFEKHPIKEAILLTEHSTRYDYTCKVALCFNYTKMIGESSYNNLGDEYEIFLIEWNTWENFERIFHDDGDEEHNFFITLKYLGITRCFDLRLEDLYHEIAGHIIEDYCASISCDHYGGYVKKVRGAR